MRPRTAPQHPHTQARACLAPLCARTGCGGRGRGQVPAGAGRGAPAPGHHHGPQGLGQGLQGRRAAGRQRQGRCAMHPSRPCLHPPPADAALRSQRVLVTCPACRPQCWSSCSSRSVSRRDAGMLRGARATPLHVLLLSQRVAPTRRLPGAQRDTPPTQRPCAARPLCGADFDTLTSIGSNSKANTVFLPHVPGAVSDLTSQIRCGAAASLWWGVATPQAPCATRGSAFASPRHLRTGADTHVCLQGRLHGGRGGQSPDWRRRQLLGQEGGLSRQRAKPGIGENAAATI